MLKVKTVKTIKSMSQIQKNKKLVEELNTILNNKSQEEFPALYYLLEMAAKRLEKQD